MVYQVTAKEILLVACFLRKSNDTMQEWMGWDVAADREFYVNCC